MSGKLYLHTHTLLLLTNTELVVITAAESDEFIKFFSDILSHLDFGSLTIGGHCSRVLLSK